MSLSIPVGPTPWVAPIAPIHYIPVPKNNYNPFHQIRKDKRQPRFERLSLPIWKDNFMSGSQNAIDSFSVIPKKYDEISVPNNFRSKKEFKLQSAVSLPWDSNFQITKKDDGVVLLVSLFTFLALIVYTSQEYLSDNLKGKDNRVIYWQVQKVLDELVLRVHSSDSAANLISRAFKINDRSTEGRSLSSNSVSSTFRHLLKEHDPLKLQTWLNTVKNNFLFEISESSYSLNNSYVNPKFYRPLQKLYFKITKPTRSGRSFSTSLLQDISATARTASNMSLKDFEKILKLINSVGKLRRHYDIFSLLKKYMPGKPVKTKYGIETIYNFPKSNGSKSRTKRFARKTRRQRMNSRYARLNDALIPMETIKRQGHKMQLINKRQGSVHSIHPDHVTSTNWADKWFSLLTQMSPIALDFTTLYSTARNYPSCLRSLLCKANNYWRKKGVLQATVTPFLRYNNII